MRDKIYTTLIYLAFGVGIIFLPFMIKALRGNVTAYPPIMQRPYIATVLLATASIWMVWLNGAHNHKLLICWGVFSLLVTFGIRKLGGKQFF